MSRLWKSFRTNMMYWRFRHVTRNRIRLRSWWQRRRPMARRPGRVRGYSPPPYRGMARPVRPRSQHRSWFAFAAMVILLTALSVLGSYYGLNGTLYGALEVGIIVGALYWALRGI